MKPITVSPNLKPEEQEAKKRLTAILIKLRDLVAGYMWAFKNKFAADEKSYFLRLTCY